MRHNPQNGTVEDMNVESVNKREPWTTLLLISLLLPACIPARATGQDQTAVPVAASSAGDMARPFGDIHQLLLDVEVNQKRAETAQRDYTYHVHTEAEDLDGQGRVRKTTVVESESLTLQGIRVNRVIARNGKPLTAEELRKEDERIDRFVQQRKKERTKLEDKGADTDGSGNALLPASRILELGQFTRPRRELLQGRPTLVLDYTGDPHAKTRNRFESVVRDLTGTVWIDEAEGVMVRGQGEFRDDFKIGGGLVANIHKGTRFDFHTVRLGEKVWLPARIDAKGSARFLLVDGVNGQVHVAMSDYRQFRSNAVISAPGNELGPDDQPIAPAQGPKPASSSGTPVVPKRP